MYRMIGADQQEYGPVSADELRAWIRDNRANGQTRARREGETGWYPLSSFPEFAADLAPPSASPAAAAPPTAPTVPSSPGPTALERRGWLEIGECVWRSWELLRANFLLLVGATFVVSMILVGAFAVPFVGTILTLVLLGPLYGGLFLLFLKRIRSQPAGITDVFAGFDQCFAQLMLAQIVVSALTLFSSFLFLFALGMAYILRSSVAMPILVVLGLCGLLPAIYLAVSWIFTIPLVIDKQMEFWPAMELSRRRVARCWLAVFGLVIVGFLLAMAGTLAFGIGVLLTTPLFFGALMYAYEDLFSSSGGSTSG